MNLVLHPIDWSFPWEMSIWRRSKTLHLDSRQCTTIISWLAGNYSDWLNSLVGVTRWWKGILGKRQLLCLLLLLPFIHSQTCCHVVIPNLCKEACRVWRIMFPALLSHRLSNTVLCPPFPAQNIIHCLVAFSTPSNSHKHPFNVWARVFQKDNLKKWLDALRGSSPARCNNNTWQCDTVQKNRIQYNTMQYHTMQWNDMQYHAMKSNKI